MTDIALPYDLAPSQIDWRLVRNVAVAESPISRSVQRQARPGDRWQATLRWDVLDRRRASALAAWLDEASRADREALIPAYGTERLRGAYAANGRAAMTRPWHAQGEMAQWVFPAGLSSALGTRGARLWQTDATLRYAERTFTLPQSARVAVTADLPAVTLWGAIIELRQGGSTVASATYTPAQAATAGRALVASGTLPAGTASVRLAIQAIPGEMEFGDVLAQMALSVSAIASPGTRSMNVTGASGTPALVAGEMLTVQTSAGWELLRVTHDAYAVSSPMTIYFEPALRGTLAAGAAVLVAYPFARMRVAESASAATYEGPVKSAFALDLVEVF